MSMGLGRRGNCALLFMIGWRAGPSGKRHVGHGKMGRQDAAWKSFNVSIKCGGWIANSVYSGYV